MGGLPDPDWYLDHVLVHAEPGRVERIDDGPAAGWQQWWRTAAAALPDDEAAQLARTQGFVVCREQLLTLGWTDADIRREVRRARWNRPARGVLSPVVVTDDDHEARRRWRALATCAALLRRPDHVASARSAAILHGLPTLGLPRQPELTTTGRDTSGRRQGAQVYEASVDAHAQTTWFGAPVMTVARTVLDVCRHDRRGGIIAADAALRENLVTPREIAVEFAGAAGWPGVRQAREVVSLADARAESPLESVVRLALHDDGFPAPELQMWVGGFRVDFCWPDRRVILEADGRVKYVGNALWDEKRREAALRALDYRVERVLWADVMHGWPAFSRRLRRLLLP